MAVGLPIAVVYCRAWRVLFGCYSRGERKGVAVLPLPNKTRARKQENGGACIPRVTQ